MERIFISTPSAAWYVRPHNLTTIGTGVGVGVGSGVGVGVAVGIGVGVLVGIGVGVLVGTGVAVGIRSRDGMG
tara:strand:+ start:437 stop:655 length:219 start_codon:yes stop_codon:yes gene_type:complete